MTKQFDKINAEFANKWTHAISLLLFCIIAFFLYQKGNLQQSLILNLSLAIFFLSEIMMFSSSTIYHMVADTKTKKKLRYFDHSAIYISIAGSYTPILLWSIGGTHGQIYFLAIWTLAIAGVIYKLIALGKHPRLSLALYLGMGWMVVLFAKTIFETFPTSSLWLLLAEGLSFSFGSYFFWKDEKYTYYHAIWHIFVTLGSLFHCGVLWFLI